MGTQTIPDRSDGQNIDETWFDVISQVVSGDFVPRTAGVATNIAGDLGSVTYLWKFLFATALKLVRVNGDNAVTIQSPTSLAAAYTLTMPAALPGSTLPVSVSSAGVLSSAQITTAQIADLAVTQAKRVALGQQLSAASGDFDTTSATAVDVTNLTVTITTTGRPVRLMIVDDGSVGVNAVGASDETAGNSVIAGVKLLRGGVAIAQQNIGIAAITSSSSISIQLPPASVQFFDAPSAGTYTYKIQTLVVSGAATAKALFRNVKLLAYEI